MIVKNLHKTEHAPTRDGYGHGLVEIGKDKRVMALCCDLTDSTRVGWFKRKYPKRFVEVGIAEQNMMGIAAGLAMLGKIPFVSSYAVFNPGRNWDQLRVSVCYSKANVKVQGAHAGISVGPDGATHQALEDIAITRALPNMTVIVPCDAIEAKKATIAAGKMVGPVYLRFGRSKVPVFTTEKTPFVIGRAQTLRKGKDATVIACGIMVYEALMAAEELKKKGMDVRVINCHTIKPIDKRSIIKAAKETGYIVTAEEHQITGGLGSAVAEVLAENCPTPMKRVGVKDHFGLSGGSEELLAKFGCTRKEIIDALCQRN